MKKPSIYYREKVFEYPAVGEAPYAYPKLLNYETLLEVAGMSIDKLKLLSARKTEILSKGVGSSYVSGRTRAWSKTKASSGDD
jgi:hypothetical protein